MNEVPDYEPISIRGAGAFGYVIEAYDRKHDTRVAIKRTHKVGNMLSREYEVLSLIKDCEYIVKLRDTFYSASDDGKVIQNLVFEYVNRSLETFIEDHKKRKNSIPVEKIRTIIEQILLGLKYCHSKNVVHRDLKPENILFTEEEKVKICDFGSAKIINSETKSTPYIVSRYYRAPELILGKVDYDGKIDIFAAGCILAELFTLTPLFPGKTEGLQIFEYMCALGNPGQNYFEKFGNNKYLEYLKSVDIQKINDLGKIINSSGAYKQEDINDATDLILNMVEWDFNKRFSAEQCLKHKFISKT